VAGVVAALAIAAPVAEASAATPRAVPFPAFAFAFVPAYIQPALAGLLSSVGPSTSVAAAYGGLALNDVLNGGTTVVVSTSPAVGSVNASP
jgi:hypothetical protein